MSFLRGISENSDAALVAELTAIVRSPHWTSLRNRGEAILDEVQRRLAANYAEHPALQPVARAMRTVEPEHITNWYIVRDSLANQFGNPWSKLAL